MRHYLEVREFRAESQADCEHLVQATHQRLPVQHHSHLQQVRLTSKSSHHCLSEQSSTSGRENCRQILDVITDLVFRSTDTNISVNINIETGYFSIKNNQKLIKSQLSAERLVSVKGECSTHLTEWTITSRPNLWIHGRNSSARHFSTRISLHMWLHTDWHQYNILHQHRYQPLVTYNCCSIQYTRCVPHIIHICKL